MVRACTVEAFRETKETGDTRASSHAGASIPLAVAQPARAGLGCPAAPLEGLTHVASSSVSAVKTVMFKTTKLSRGCMKIEEFKMALPPSIPREADNVAVEMLCVA